MVPPTDGVLLVGGGKMGRALVVGWLREILEPTGIEVVEPSESTASDLRRLGVSVVGSPKEVVNSKPPSVIVYAVKPQMMAEVLSGYASCGDTDTLHLSIAAGCPIALLERCLGAVPVVRAMPNTPASIGCGMTVLCANPSVTEDQRAMCEHLLTAVGVVDWIEDEMLMDAVTAVSGSGPAYVFLLTESLIHAGITAGLSAELARRLAEETVSGAGALIAQSEETVEALRRKVTSPGGTTAAALKVLMADDGLAPLISRAVHSAAQRSRSLGC